MASTLSGTSSPYFSGQFEYEQMMRHKQEYLRQVAQQQQQGLGYAGPDSAAVERQEKQQRDRQILLLLENEQ